MIASGRHLITYTIYKHIHEPQRMAIQWGRIRVEEWNSYHIID